MNRLQVDLRTYLGEDYGLLHLCQDDFGPVVHFQESHVVNTCVLAGILCPPISVSTMVECGRASGAVQPALSISHIVASV